MKKLTTLEVIKILPLEQNLKNKLLANWDNIDSGRKYGLVNILWDYYDALYEMRLKTNIQQALERVKIGKEKLSQELYKQARNKTEQEMEITVNQNLTNQEIQIIRSKLQTIITQSSLGPIEK